MGRRANQRASRRPQGQPNTESQSSNTQRSKPKSFIKKHWAIILSLLIASSGGVPGCITIWNTAFHSRPIITFNANNINYGLRPDNVWQFLESWTIINSGDKPLILMRIDGYVKCNGIEYKLNNASPPETYTGNSDDGKDRVTIRNVRARDLQLVKQILPNDYKRGFLDFLIDKTSMYNVSQCGDEAELKIVCYDFSGNVYDSGYRKFGGPIQRNGVDTLFSPHDSIEITRR